MRQQLSVILAIGFLGSFAAACSGSDGATGPAGTNGSAATNGAAGATGPTGPAGGIGPAGEAGAPATANGVAPPGVYTMTNAPAGNEILAFSRGGDGNLTPLGSYPTGGKGAAFPSQGSLEYDADLGVFFAVNGGDNSISMMKLNADGSLAMVANVPSGGVAPASIAVSGSTLYVANQGSTAAPAAAANITAFTISATTLTPLANSTQAFGTANPTPVEIAYSPNGKVLIVTEKTGNNVDSFAITNGVAGPVQSVSIPDFALSGGTSTTGEPFGFAFGASGTLIVTLARNGMGMSAEASFTVADTGVLTPVTNLANPQLGSCWLATSGDFAWSVNTASGSVSSMAVGTDGTLSLVNAPTGLNGSIGAKATDVAVSPDGGFLYAVSSNGGQLAMFDIYADGTLNELPSLHNLPTTIGGLVAR